MASIQRLIDCMNIKRNLCETNDTGQTLALAPNCSDVPETCYSSSIEYPLSKSLIKKISGQSYKEGCPVALSDLACVHLTHWNMDFEVQRGELICHKKLAIEISEIFQELFESRFPVQSINLIDDYNADDMESMQANNSSAFCSREITGKKGVYSKHSYGVAIDINPLYNPYVNGECVLPKKGIPFLDRDLNVPGMIHESDACYNAFVKRGYTWGGNWNKPYKDYHHFEKDPSLVFSSSSELLNASNT